MKKLIKDLTIEEIVNECDKRGFCKDCPFIDKRGACNASLARDEMDIEVELLEDDDVEA